MPAEEEAAAAPAEEDAAPAEGAAPAEEEAQAPAEEAAVEAPVEKDAAAAPAEAEAEVAAAPAEAAAAAAPAEAGSEIKDLIAQLFAIIDVDESGSLDKGELLMMERKLAKALKHPFNEEETIALIEKVDTDGNGSISIEEYAAVVTDHSQGDGDGQHLFSVHDAESLRLQITYLTNQSTFERELRKCFSLMDRDGDGKITKEEEKEINTMLLKAINPDASDEEIDAQAAQAGKDEMADLDVDGDGLITFAEFCNKWFEQQAINSWSEEEAVENAGMVTEMWSSVLGDKLPSPP